MEINGALQRRDFWLEQDEHKTRLEAVKRAVEDQGRDLYIIADFYSFATSLDPAPVGWEQRRNDLREDRHSREAQVRMNVRTFFRSEWFTSFMLLLNVSCLGTRGGTCRGPVRNQDDAERDSNFYLLPREGGSFPGSSSRRLSASHPPHHPGLPIFPPSLLSLPSSIISF